MKNIFFYFFFRNGSGPCPQCRQIVSVPMLQKVHFNFHQETPLLGQQSSSNNNNQFEKDTAKLRKSLEQLEQVEREYFKVQREQAENNINQLHAARSRCKFSRQSGVSFHCSILGMNIRGLGIYFSFSFYNFQPEI